MILNYENGWLSFLGVEEIKLLEFAYIYDLIKIEIIIKAKEYDVIKQI